jgi:hypothetical protein
VTECSKQQGEISDHSKCIAFIYCVTEYCDQ